MKEKQIKTVLEVLEVELSRFDGVFRAYRAFIVIVTQ